MARTNWRKWFRILHRDIGYFIFGTTLIFAISGIALNHKEDWDPSYQVEAFSFKVDDFKAEDADNEAALRDLVNAITGQESYRKHYLPNPKMVKIFIDRGTITFSPESGNGKLERIQKRPLFNQFNMLHQNVGGWWLWFSDLFSTLLIITAVTGIFILKGNKGITRRGGVLTLLGIAAPFALALFYL